jgi:predicted small lipoprotein YifL
MNVKTAFVSALFVVLTACSKQEPAALPPQTANDKMAQDIAKIREIKEQEQKDKAAREAKTKEFGDGMKRGADAPIREFK